MKKTIAVPVTGGLLSAHFGHCEQFYFATIDGQRVVNERFVTPPAHEPGLYPKWVREQGADLVIAGGMGQRACDLFAQNGVQTLVGANAGAPREVVEWFLKGALQTHENPCNHDTDGHSC